MTNNLFFWYLHFTAQRGESQEVLKKKRPVKFWEKPNFFMNWVKGKEAREFPVFLRKILDNRGVAVI